MGGIKLVSRFFVFGLIGLIAAPAQAELPDYVLDKDYQSCIADGKDANRDAYCACVRQGMRGWSEQDYMDVAQAAKAGLVSDRLGVLAKQCMAKTLH